MGYINELNKETVNELADIFGCKIRTIYRWFDRFESEKIEGIYELKGREELFLKIASGKLIGIN